MFELFENEVGSKKIALKPGEVVTLLWNQHTEKDEVTYYVEVNNYSLDFTTLERAKETFEKLLKLN